MTGHGTPPPGLAGMESMARAALKTIPERLRRHVRGVVIRVEEFPPLLTRFSRKITLRFGPGPILYRPRPSMQQLRQEAVMEPP